MPKYYYLGIDQGTTGTTAMIFDQDWNVCSKGYAEHTQHYPRPGWVEHNPLEIWSKMQQAVGLALDQAGLKPYNIRAIGLDNQGETCLAWDRKTGLPLYNAIVWQDRRTANAADALAARYAEIIHGKTGLKVDAYFSALKLKWLLDNVAELKIKAADSQLALGTLDTWLIWKMTGGRCYLTDPSTASRTMLFNLQDAQWDSEILDILEIPAALLPEVCDSAGNLVYTGKNDFLEAAVPLTGIIVDQAAALFGQTCFRNGSVKTTYGTGCFMLMNTGNRPVFSRQGLLTTVGWSMDGKLTYALDGGVYIAGAAVQWLRDKLQIIDSAAETESLAMSVPDTADVYFVPAFVGLAAPYWDQYARGTIVGLTGGATRAHIVRATLEAIAFQVAENLDVMKQESGDPIEVMRVDGGAVVNEFLMQFQADILGIAIDVPEINETSALGAAMLAAIGIGDVGSLDEMGGKWKLRKRYVPCISEDHRQVLRRKWARAVQRSRCWAEHDHITPVLPGENTRLNGTTT